GVTDGVGVVAVHVVAVAGEKSLEALHPGDIGCAVEPVIARGGAGHGKRGRRGDTHYVNPLSDPLSCDRSKDCTRRKSKVNVALCDASSEATKGVPPHGAFLPGLRR